MFGKDPLGSAYSSHLMRSGSRSLDITVHIGYDSLKIPVLDEDSRFSLGIVLLLTTFSSFCT